MMMMILDQSEQGKERQKQKGFFFSFFFLSFLVLSCSFVFLLLLFLQIGSSCDSSSFFGGPYLSRWAAAASSRPSWTALRARSGSAMGMGKGMRRRSHVSLLSSTMTS